MNASLRWSFFLSAIRGFTNSKMFRIYSSSIHFLLNTLTSSHIIAFSLSMNFFFPATPRESATETSKRNVTRSMNKKCFRFSTKCTEVKYENILLFNLTCDSTFPRVLFCSIFIFASYSIWWTKSGVHVHIWRCHLNLCGERKRQKADTFDVDRFRCETLQREQQNYPNFDVASHFQLIRCHRV